MVFIIDNKMNDSAATDLHICGLISDACDTAASCIIIVEKKTFLIEVCFAEV